MKNWTVANAFYAPAGTIIEYRHDNAEQVAALVDGGICEWCYVQGARKLITL